MPSRERDIQDAIRQAVDPTVAVFWRNNVGVATHFDERTGHVSKVRYGLAVGSSDLVGLRTRDGRFVALEVKKPGEYPTPEQRQWLALVNRCGGIGRVVRSVEEALEALR